MKKILFNKEQIDSKVLELANIINTKIIQENEMEKPILLCVLDGGFRFYSDLISHIMRFYKDNIIYS